MVCKLGKENFGHVNLAITFSAKEQSNNQGLKFVSGVLQNYLCIIDVNGQVVCIISQKIWKYMYTVKILKFRTPENLL